MSEYALEKSSIVSSWPFSSIVLFPLAILAIYYIAIGIRHRLSNRNLPGPPHSFLFGSIPVMAGVIKDLPAKAHPEHMMTTIHRKYNLGGLFFLDSWPAESESLMIIGDPVIAAQVTQKRSLPKSPKLWDTVGHLVGPTSMVLTEGTLWKSMRSMFNPAFTSGHLRSFVPSIINECLIFCEVLTEHASKGDVFSLEEVATRLTIDVIGLVALGVELRSQTTENELVSAFRKQASWTDAGGDFLPFKKLNPLRPIITTYYKSKIHGYIERVIEKRSEARQSGTKMDQKPAIDFALNEFAAQQGGQSKSDGIFSTSKGFKLAVIDQMKTFMFAGHDTTSSTICYIYYMLSLHAEKMHKVLQEHNKVFGRDISLAAGQLKANPNLLSDLPYTVAVIRETLRMFPIGSTIRAGDDTLISYEGKSYPTRGYLIIVHNHLIARRADLFPSPDDFIPERFLPAPNNFQEVPTDAWRPFEKGSRNCLGQELAMLEAKIIMVLTLRKFDISAAYEEMDAILGRKDPGQMFGFRGYQVCVATAKPVDGMPARVKMRTGS